MRAADPAKDLRFSSALLLGFNLSAPAGRLIEDEPWARGLQLTLSVSNLTDQRRRVREASGAIPNRYQPDYLDPVGRQVTLILRKLF